MSYESSKLKRIIEEKTILIIVYSILILDLVLFFSFIFGNRLFIFHDIGSDTFRSYFPATYLIAEKLLFNLKGWSFNIGAGTNIFSLISQFGDPYNLFLYLFGKENIATMMVFIAILKNVTAGLFTYIYLGQFQFRKETKILSSVLFAFNGFIMLWGQHYSFASWLTFLPLFMFSFELWIQKNKGIPFIFCTALLAIKFYFFYQVILLLFAYFIFRILFDWEFFKKKLSIPFLLKTLGLFLLGLSVSASLLLPQLFLLINSPRIDVSVGNKVASFFKDLFLLGDLKYYTTLIFRSFSNNILGDGLNYFGASNYYEAPQLSMSLLTLFIIPQLFTKLRKQKRKLYVLIASYVIIFIFVLFPAFSKIFNGFQAIAYRWHFVIIFFNLYVFALAFNQIVEGQWEINKKVLLLSLAGILLILFGNLMIVKLSSRFNLDEFQYRYIVKNLIVLLALSTAYTSVLFLWKKNLNMGLISLALLVGLEILFLNYFTINHRNTVTKNDIESGNYYWDGTKNAVEFIKMYDSGFYRIDKDFLSFYLNDSFYQNYYGFNNYSSLTNPYYYKFLTTIYSEGYSSHIRRKHPNYLSLRSTDYPSLTNLLGQKYFLTRNANKVLLGYEPLYSDNGVLILENQNPRSLGFTYNFITTLEHYMALPEDDRVSLLLESCVVSDDVFPDMPKYSDITFEWEDILIEYSSKLRFRHTHLIENHLPESISLKADTSDPSIIFDNLSFNQFYGDKTLKLCFSMNSMESTQGQIFYSKTDNGFNEENSLKFEIQEGLHDYSFSLKPNMEVNHIRLDYSSVTQDIEILDLKVFTRSKIERFFDDGSSSDKFQNLIIDDFSESRITGHIETEREQILFFSIPYSKGWTLKIDGESTPLEIVNVGFMGAYLDSGFHRIELRFSPPWFKLGLIMTIISLLMIAIYVSSKRKKSNRDNSDEKNKLQ